ncbi:MAG TPA: EpsI family protein [Candidatus Sulfotelmatobacter sp.]|nr:EpsI family protein [Candidatus Sulfotelmatobacter sp.]
MTLRFVVAALLIASTAVFMHAHNSQEIFPPRLSLQTFPINLGSWKGTDSPIDKDALDVLGKGEFLLRIYQNTEQPQPFVDLFIAYYSSQRTGETPHSPQHCLPGAGWAAIENTRVKLSMPGHEPFPVNRYVISKQDARQIVLYWFWAHNRGLASEYWNKYYLVADSIKMNRSDGSLIRITSPILPGETVEAAQQRISPFVNSVLPLLDDYIPR